MKRIVIIGFQLFMLWLVIIYSGYSQSSNNVIAINLQIENNGMTYVPCRINGRQLSLIFDTGASFVSLSSKIYDELTRDGRLIPLDTKGSLLTKLADGSIVKNKVINIEKFSIGGLFIMYNVTAVVSPNEDAPLLFGQSVISRLENWKIDQINHVLTQIMH